MSNHERHCAVCGKSVAEADGQVLGTTFGDDLRALYKAEAGRDAEDGAIDKSACERLRGSNVGPFVDAVTGAYFTQFRELYAPDDDGPTVDSAKRLAFLAKARDPRARLPEVLEKYPEIKYAWLLVHTACTPDDGLDPSDDISLTQIASAEQAIQWTIHLSDNASWDGTAWSSVLQSLFGRRASGLASGA